MSSETGQFTFNAFIEEENRDLICEINKDQSFSENLIIARNEEGDYFGINPEIKVKVDGSILKLAWALWKSEGSSEYYSWLND